MQIRMVYNYETISDLTHLHIYQTKPKVNSIKPFGYSKHAVIFL